MNASQIIEEVQESASEWIEMAENPAALVAGILAQQIVNLKGHIIYLENRLRHEERRGR